MSRIASHAAGLVAAATLAVTGLASAQPSPLDPAASPAPMPARGGLAGDYRPLPPLDPLPWRALFDAGGAFVEYDRPAQPPLATAQAGGSGHSHDHGAAPAGAPAPAAPPTPAATADDMVPAGADGVATVLRVDREAKRVRLRHGPIPRLEMPGMTMLFQVADPALLDAVTVGETLGFRVEQRGQAFVITDWVRGGAK